MNDSGGTRRTDADRKPKPGASRFPATIPRVVQRAGPSSLVVGIPRRWAEREGIHPGQFVTWIFGSDSELRLEPPHRSGYPSGEASLTLRTDRWSGPEMSVRLARAAYVLGFSQVRFEASSTLDPEVRVALNRAMTSLVGAVITQERERFVEITYLVDPSSHPQRGVLRRMGTTVEAIMDGVASALRLRSSRGLDALPEMLQEAHRIHALALRQLNLSVYNPELAHALGISKSSHLLGGRVAANLLESIVDSYTGIAAELSRAQNISRAASGLTERLADRIDGDGEALRTALAMLERPDLSRAGASLEHHRNGSDSYFEIEESIWTGSYRPSLRRVLATTAWWVGVGRQHVDALAEVALLRSIEAAHGTNEVVDYREIEETPERKREVPPS
jgi:phosphate uptake regulator